jgi:ferredoxin
MRQNTRYTDDNREECIISYKCEGCGRRVRVTPDQARHFRSAFTACSRVCVLKAHEFRTQQRRLIMDQPEAAEGTGPEAGAAPV